MFFLTIWFAFAKRLFNNWCTQITNITAISVICLTCSASFVGVGFERSLCHGQLRQPKEALQQNEGLPVQVEEALVSVSSPSSQRRDVNNRCECLANKYSVMRRETLCSANCKRFHEARQRNDPIQTDNLKTRFLAS